VTVTAHGTPAVADALRGPGTPLGDGFSVPGGAAVVGAALPSSRQTGYPDLGATDAWGALLLVTGESRDVAKALARQGARVGLTAATAIPAECVDAVDPCTTRLVAPGRVRDAFAPRELWIHVAPNASLMMLQYTGFEPARADSRLADPAPATVRLPPEPADAQPPPTLPKVGDPITLDLGGGTVRVQGGSEPLTAAFCHPRPLCFGEDMVVMRVTGGGETFDRYLRATRALDRWDREYRREPETRDGWRVRSHSFTTIDGGPTYELFERDGAPTYLRISLSTGA
jgi:hypothetical protein